MNARFVTSGWVQALGYLGRDCQLPQTDRSNAGTRHWILTRLWYRSLGCTVCGESCACQIAAINCDTKVAPFAALCDGVAACVATRGCECVCGWQGASMC